MVIKRVVHETSKVVVVQDAKSYYHRLQKIPIIRYSVNQSFDEQQAERNAQLKEYWKKRREMVSEWKLKNGLKGPPPRLFFNPTLLDFRVGKINHCIKHPDADNLLNCAVSCGDDPDGAVAATSLEEFKRMGIDTLLPKNEAHRNVMFNLKLVRGFRDPKELIGLRVVLCSNVAHTAFRGYRTAGIIQIAQQWDTWEPGPSKQYPIAPLATELVVPPSEAEIGEQLVFEGYDEGHWLIKRNSKRWNFWTWVAEGITTNAKKEIIFDGSRIDNPDFQSLRDTPARLVRVGLGPEGGLCTVPTIVKARIR
ncbi:hypothetical protein BJ508DRAFT_417335 [Ascobolus immersus RN42]|uniref:tRNA-binding domain-containing protein n=1 Tax=Ascobolus immersus RN42 TaxID=1160509 RepID=A0A3N4HT43_ASCIM|nr:hypothetical protein BJ508DRAFT_417335 [Ascobolus immersus RN42]